MAWFLCYLDILGCVTSSNSMFFFCLFTKKIPIQTKTRAIRVLTLNIFSSKNIDDNIVPKTGIKKLKTAIFPTLLYLRSSVHNENAVADKTAIYIKSATD